MAVQHIEIHQIAKNESTLPLTGCYRQFFHAVGVAFCRYVLADAAAIVDVMNLADSENSNFSFHEDVHQHRLRRVDDVIVTPCGPHKISLCYCEWPCDHAPDDLTPNISISLAVVLS